MKKNTFKKNTPFELKKKKIGSTIFACSVAIEIYVPFEKFHFDIQAY